MSMIKKKPGWRKMRTCEEGAVEEMLRTREALCVGAVNRFLRRNDKSSGKLTQVWVLECGGSLSAVLIHYRRSLFPVFFGRLHTPPPHFLRSFLSLTSMHSIQGLKEEELSLEKGMVSMGYIINEALDYDLMTLDNMPEENNFRAGPAGLIIRKAELNDMASLFELQAAYDKEEVLPPGGEFFASAARLNLEHIVKRERIFTAELNGRLVGKINTTAASFTRRQIGGVYVHPDFRRLGIARRMTAEMARSLIADNWGVSLFVKKRNAAARAAYLHNGFTPIADYRICYFEQM